MVTVYILGHGASKAVAGLPVMDEFLEGMAGKVKDYPYLVSYLGKRFSHLRPNIEHVLADLDNALHGLGALWYSSGNHPERIQAQQALSDLMKYMEARLGGTAGNTAVDCDEIEKRYNHVLGDLKERGKWVLTFNYDCTLRRSLRSPSTVVSQGCDIAARNQLEYTVLNGGDVLKLHGSIDFRVCRNPYCAARGLVLVGSLGDGKLSLGERKPYICSECGADLETLIIPPSMNKSFAEYPFLARQFRLAQAALGLAERLVVWGFSCPPSDHHLAWLVRCNRPYPALKTIQIIDQEPEPVRTNLENLLGPIAGCRWEVFTDHTKYPCIGQTCSFEGKNNDP